MYYVADPDRLLQDGILTPAQIDTLKARGREVLMMLGANAILTAAIITATLGLMFWLADPLSVAIFGGLAIAGGLLALRKGGAALRFFGNAAILIGAGLLLGGSHVELVENHELIAGPVMLALGGAVAIGTGLLYRHPRLTARFTCGAVMMMGVALHLGGVIYLADENAWTGLPLTLASLHAALVIAAAGTRLDVRPITAFAILPFAQALSVDLDYWHHLYAVVSPEPTFTILQMLLLLAAAGLARPHLTAPVVRHAAILAVAAIAVAGFAAIHGAVEGDYLGDYLWGPGSYRNLRSVDPDADYQVYSNVLAAFLDRAVHVPAGLYAISFTMLLAAAILHAAVTRHPLLLNGAVAFAALHAFILAHHHIGDDAMVNAVGGLLSIPLAWTMWQVNRRWAARRDTGWRPD